MTDRHTSHSTYNIYYHFTFCPKFRHKVLIKGVDEKLKVIFNKIAEDYKFEIIEQEIMEDHVHLFISAPPSLSPGKIISIIKSISGSEIFMLYPNLKKTHSWKKGFWASSFYVETIGSVSKENIIKYIKNQKNKKIV